MTFCFRFLDLGVSDSLSEADGWLESSFFRLALGFFLGWFLRSTDISAWNNRHEDRKWLSDLVSHLLFWKYISIHGHCMKQISLNRLHMAINAWHNLELLLEFVQQDHGEYKILE